MIINDNIRNERLIEKMIEYYAGDSRRIQHFIKVSSFAKTIAILENTDKSTAELIYTAAVVHDIGIKPAEEKYGKGNCGGNYQQELGPAPARKMLLELGFSQDTVERVCFLVAHHHNYENVEGIDWQILLEADFLVNAFEDNLNKDTINKFKCKVFRTQTGISMLETMYGL